MATKAEPAVTFPIRLNSKHSKSLLHLTKQCFGKVDKKHNRALIIRAMIELCSKDMAAFKKMQKIARDNASDNE